MLSTFITIMFRQALSPLFPQTIREQTLTDSRAEMHVAEMDKAGVKTAMLAQYSGFWFGDVNQARRDARELNEWAIAKMVDPHKGRFGLFASLPLPDVESTLREIEYAFDTLKAMGSRSSQVMTTNGSAINPSSLSSRS